MIITNKTNLPASVVNLARSPWYQPKGDISATSLIKPVRITALRKRHSKNLEIDVQEMAWTILGSAVHVMLERSGSESGDVILEKRLHTNILGWDVNGQDDIYYVKEHKIEDYKVTSIGNFTRTDGADWEAQLNINAYLHRIHDQPVVAVSNIIFLKDFSLFKSRVNKNYPQNPIQVTSYPVWSIENQRDYIHERVALHQKYKDVPDDELPLCTPQERWFADGGFSVLKAGNKRATRVFEKREDAERFVIETSPSLKPKERYLPIIEKEGVNRRCEDYCEARHFCSFAKKIREDRGRQPDSQPAFKSEDEGEPEMSFEGVE